MRLHSTSLCGNGVCVCVARVVWRVVCVQVSVEEAASLGSNIFALLVDSLAQQRIRLLEVFREMDKVRRARAPHAVQADTHDACMGMHQGLMQRSHVCVCVCAGACVCACVYGGVHKVCKPLPLVASKTAG